jgi:5-methylcytosine-specific restriction endonuclease McrA
MPNKTRLLEYGGFVHSPDVPTSPAFAEYLSRIDPLMAAWEEAVESLQRSTSAELLECKKAAQQKLEDFAAAYRNEYTIKPVERNPAFLPVARFFARYRPVRQSFSILYCNLEMPLHTVYAFDGVNDMASVNAALNQVTPLRWWQDGPMNHPCYLFGDCIWELKLTEVEASDKGLTLLFDQTTEKDRLQRDRLQHDLTASRSPIEQRLQFIPEAVRTAVWRRDNAKCARCGGREDVDFVVVTPPLHGNPPAAQNVQLLCARCRAK